jgi:uncharacterized damage-inducible protein DinB
VSSILAEFFRHNVWANLRVIDTCGEAGAEALAATISGTYGDIHATLVHLVAAEERYLARLIGAPLPDLAREGDPLPDLAALRERARRSGEGLLTVAAGADRDDVVRGVWRGEPFAIPRSTLLIQAINHGTDHRSQICTILTQQGIVPPDIDGWTYDAERSDAP